MPEGDVEVVIVGGGAAGIGAARRLHDAGVDVLIVEARSRLGGRAWTDTETAGHALDLGCGWLHSADRNPWRLIAERQGHAIDMTPPPWYRPWLNPNFPRERQIEFRRALEEFHERMASYPDEKPDAAATMLLEPGCAWNPLLGAVTTYLSGVEPDRLSVRDFADYADSGVNWRVFEGYGAVIAAHADGIAVKLNCAVKTIDASGRRLKVTTVEGGIAADMVIVTLSSNLIADEAIEFIPALPKKAEWAAGVPLGLADKLFLSLTDADEFEKDSRMFGRVDATETAAYHLRPFGRSEIEVYFGGTLAGDLEREGERAFVDFAFAELSAILGGDFIQRLTPLRVHRWGSDPYARGSYSSALPGKSGNRALLAAPIDDRIFFAGEACSRHDYSTAHGAYLTGLDAAEIIIAARAAREKARSRRTRA